MGKAILSLVITHWSCVVTEMLCMRTILIGYRLILLMRQYNTGELSEQEDKDILDRVAECYKLILEAGADFGIESHGNSCFRDVLAFERSVSSRPHLTMFTVLD